MERPTRADDLEDGTVEALGYNLSYTRMLRGAGNVCLVIAMTSPVASLFVSGAYNIVYGGYWGLVWGWIVPTFVLFPQVLAIAELCSAMPVNGGNFWWTAALAPPALSRPLSFISGCTTVVATFTGVASFAYASASGICAATEIIQPDWIATPGQKAGVAYAVLALWASTMGLRIDNISWVLVACTVLTLAQTLTYIIGIPATHAVQGQPFATGKQVFGTYENFSDWSAAVAVPITWFSSAWVNSVWYTPAYVVESTHNARRAAPLAMISSFWTCAITGALALTITAFCIPDMETSAEDPTGYPIFSLLVAHWGAKGAFGMIIGGAVASVVGGCGFVLSLSFQIAAFARDGGLPRAEIFTKVNSRTNSPLGAAALLVTGTCLVLLFGLSPVASGIIYSLSVIANLVTFSIPVGLRLFAGDRHVQGPFNLGRYSIPVFAWAFVTQWYLIIMQSFPLSKVWTPSTFNFNWVVTLGALLISALIYAVWGKHYKGPDMEALRQFRHDHSDQALLRTLAAHQHPTETLISENPDKHLDSDK